MKKYVTLTENELVGLIRQKVNENLKETVKKQLISVVDHYIDHVNREMGDIDDGFDMFDKAGHVINFVVDEMEKKYGVDEMEGVSLDEYLRDNLSDYIFDRI